MQAVFLLICFWKGAVIWAFDDYCNQTHKNKNEMTAIIGSTKILKCPVGKQVNLFAWEKFNVNDTIVAEGTKINPDYQRLNKFAIDRRQKEYNLIISNISTADGGKYCCEQTGFRCCVLLYVKEAPEVSVIQLDNGSLLCSATGFPDNISYLRWEHKSPERKHLRYLKGTENGILNFNTSDGKTGLDSTYSLDGIYICNVVNHMTKDGDTNFQTGFANVLFKGTPECLRETVGTDYTDGSVKLQVDVYSSSNVSYNWLDSEVELPVKQSPKHKVTITESQTMVEMYNHQVQLNSTNIILEISDVDQQDTRSYILEVSNNHGTSNCTVVLPKRRKGSRKVDKVKLAILSCGSAAIVLLIIAIVLKKIGKHRVSKKTQKRENMCYHRHEKQFNTYSMARMRNEVFEEVTLNRDERDKGKRFTICSVVQDV
ncbi:HMCN [Mytilus coruscus]|uniref:HMCN n=1 Tax=Mytilus coruscus TaxID=42192 RepID=A0A6J8CYN6_MYTCO|nr:HMCN [Mytilus coruscus]